MNVFQIEQLEHILSEKDKAIEELSASLQSVTENRDLLQAEYVEQASQLTQQVHTLQEQLRQVRSEHACAHTHVHACTL